MNKNPIQMHLKVPVENSWALLPSAALVDVEPLALSCTPWSHDMEEAS